MKKIFLILAFIATMMPGMAQRHSANASNVQSSVTTIITDADDSVFCDTGYCDTDEYTECIYSEDTVFSTTNLPPELAELVEEMGLATSDMALGMVAIICIFVICPLICLVLLPILILWLIFRYRRKKQQEEHEFIKSLAASGQDVSQYLNRGYHQTSNDQRPTTNDQRPIDSRQQTIQSKHVTDEYRYNYDKGIKNAIIGGTIAVICLIFEWPSVFTLGGFILLAVGISQILSAKNSLRYDHTDEYRHSTGNYSHNENSNAVQQPSSDDTKPGE